jgi:hypothetical protein
MSHTAKSLLAAVGIAGNNLTSSRVRRVVGQQVREDLHHPDCFATIVEICAPKTILSIRSLVTVIVIRILARPFGGRAAVRGISSWRTLIAEWRFVAAPVVGKLAPVRTRWQAVAAAANVSRYHRLTGGVCLSWHPVQAAVECVAASRTVLNLVAFAVTRVPAVFVVALFKALL